MALPCQRESVCLLTVAWCSAERAAEHTDDGCGKRVETPAGRKGIAGAGRDDNEGRSDERGWLRLALHGIDPVGTCPSTCRRHRDDEHSARTVGRQPA